MDEKTGYAEKKIVSNNKFVVFQLYPRRVHPPRKKKGLGTKRIRKKGIYE